MSAGFMVSISATGYGRRHMKRVNVILSRLTLMTVKPFFAKSPSYLNSLVRNQNGLT
jgi:hypothetical protein